jgi:hypothetical protein
MTLAALYSKPDFVAVLVLASCQGKIAMTSTTAPSDDVKIEVIAVFKDAELIRVCLPIAEPSSRVLALGNAV